MSRSWRRVASSARSIAPSSAAGRRSDCLVGTMRIEQNRGVISGVSSGDSSHQHFPRHHHQQQHCSIMDTHRDFQNKQYLKMQQNNNFRWMQLKNHRTMQPCRSFSAANTFVSEEEENNNNDDDDDDTSSDNDEEEESDGLEYLTELSPGIRSRIRAMKSRHDEILAQMQDFDNLDNANGGGVGGDATSLGKELSSLSGISSLCEQASQIHAERTSLLELLNETKSSSRNDDDGEIQDEEALEMIDEIEEELTGLEEQCTALSHKLLHSLVPLLNPEDVQELTSSDAVIDIRAGTGGDEACLFASEIMAGYEAIAKAGGGGDDGDYGGKSWEVEVLSVSRTDLGGVKEASLVVSSNGGGGGGGYGGFDSNQQQQQIPQTEEELTSQLMGQLGPYGFFRFESGVHRVQRVPVNDVRMQTSAVSVAILPSLPDSALPTALPPNELKIETMRASGAGGQHVNTTESAVRVTHIPTGVMAYIQEERSQHKNRAKALKLVAARVYSQRREQAAKDRSAARSSLMGGGDRSERIRTYNFPQDRITDHRCKVSVSGVSSWMSNGSMVRNFAPHMYSLDREERMKYLEEEEEENERKKQNDGDGGKKKGRKGKRN